MISGAVSSEDYLAALRLHRRRVVRRQQLILASLALTGVIVLAVAGYSLFGLVLVGAGVGGLIGEFVQSRFYLPRAAEKIHSQQASLRVTYTYSWDSERLSASSETGHANRPWSDYIKILEGDSLILLYHSDIMFEIFPKSWFSSQEQVHAFRTLATRAGT